MLKSLQLDGFKSFAEKTRLEFPAGVTVIVGPNGSGKSNVVDAVKWVLGSQSPRGLRGKEMTDVIFNGAEARAPVGLAEVTLAFDNQPAADGRRLFDLDEREVRLTRRVYRTGEGEYLLNGHACRLRDLRQLLAGTGLGPDSYSIIEQGRVDAALQASPAERRLLFEEAAGISRLRLKKREATKRLERVEQNLLRLSDIVDEVETRLRRVRSQAGKARRYREASVALRDAQRRLAVIEWRALAERRTRFDAEAGDLDALVTESRVAITVEESRLAELERQAAVDDGADARARRARDRHARTAQAAATAYAAVRLAEERVAERQAELAERRAAAAAAGESASAAALAEAEATAAEYAEAIELAESAAASTRQARDELAGRLAEDSHRRGRRERFATRGAERSARIAKRLADAQQNAAEAGAAMAAAEAEHAAATAALDEAVAGRDAAADALLGIDQASGDAERARVAARARGEQAERSLAAGRERLVSLRHRLETLEAERLRLERLNTDVARLADPNRSASPEVYGLVADLIHVDPDLAPTVEAALGERAGHVAVDSQAMLLAALDEATQRGEPLGARAAFQSVDAEGPATALDQIDLSAEPGVVGRAGDFVEVEPRFATLVRRLFARTWFVATLADATRLAGSVGRGLTFVTLAGDVVGADGSVVAGPSDAAGVLMRDEAAGRAARDVEQAEKQVAELTEQVEAAKAKLADAEAAQQQQRAEADAARATLADATQRAAVLEERRRHADATRTRQRARGEALRIAIVRLGERAANTDRRVAAVLDAIGGDADAAVSADDLAAADARLATERGRLEALRTAAERHGQLLASLRSSPAADAATDEHARLDGAFARFTAACEERAAAELAALAASGEWAEAALAAEACDRDERQRREADRVARRARGEVAATLAAARGELEDLVRRQAHAEGQRGRVAAEREQLERRVREEFADEAEDVFAAARCDTEAHDAGGVAALRQTIDTLRREVASVGAVNLESLEELDELETRFAELDGQYRDLSEARASLARLTGRINRDSRDLFAATFETVRGHFQELFARLFGGGEADLILVGEDGDASGDGDDPLEAGVDIVACPPGKELRSLSLMSGGEKTMTCVALLFALFRSRPSPFCLLDEVDAALDEANVGRFLDVLRDFLGETQFLVISHSKRTMAGADTVYGVTMQESGVSKQVSVRLEDVAEDGTIDPRRVTEAGEGGDGPALRRAA